MIDLQPFCGAHDREAFRQPFSFGAFTWATDSTILVRVARRADVADIDLDPGLDRGWHEWPTTLRKIGTAQLPAISWKNCWYCLGIGADMDDGTPCRVCAATGRMAKLKAVRCGSVLDQVVSISLHNAHRLASLPRVRLGVAFGSHGPTITPVDPILAFEFEGGAGCCIPLAFGHNIPVVGEI